MKQMLSDVRQYVIKWLEVNKIKINGKGHPIDVQKRDLGQLLDTMLLDYNAQVRAYNFENPKEAIKGSANLLEIALREYVAILTRAARAQAMETLKYDGADDVAVNDFIEACTGEKDPMATAVIKHWIWGVKNRGLGREITYHICPVFFSVAQGSGKSTAIKKLTSVVADYRGDYDMSSIADSRYQTQLGVDLVGVLDEMSGASRTDVDALKRVITANHLSIRKLGTNIVDDIFIRCSFIGSSNKNITELVQDGGMRRFFQINTLARLDWEKINNINYLELWRSVDENRVDGYLQDVIAEISETQKTYEVREHVQEFMEELQLLSVPSTAPYSLVSFRDVVQAYQEWCVANGFKNLTANWLSAKLSTFGQKTLRIKDDKSSKTYLKVAPTCKLPKATPGEYKEINNLKAL